MNDGFRGGSIADVARPLVLDKIIKKKQNKKTTYSYVTNSP